MAVFLRLNRPAIGAMLQNTAGAAVRQAAYVTRGRARANLQAAGRNATGRLMSSIDAREAGPFQWTVGSPLHYAIYQEEGVAGPVYPVRAKVLRFRSKQTGQIVFARSTRGFPGAHYLRDAYRALSAADFIP